MRLIARSRLGLRAVALTTGLAISGTSALPVFSQDVQSAAVVVRGDQPGAVINRNIYGHFAEHLGRCIYEGIWV
ncbi:MAG TPA: hypothetical protein P5159_23645, partial [Phycisphaerae bacterium]|nr:hypothetical protein [Phycisphaerae bacterium]